VLRGVVLDFSSVGVFDGVVRGVGVLELDGFDAHLVEETGTGG
jgi:hypothetical protein